MGLELLAKPHVAIAIREAEAARSQRSAMTADRGLLELAALACSDMRDHAPWGPERLKLYNTLQALEALGKHVDVFHAPTADELDEDAFMRDFMAVVFKHVTEPAARAEIKAVINAHLPPGRVRDVTPIGAR